jgi:NAD(P)-dependent dehydrogenase (short-subunit alcohol dehydrogenase family)
LNDMQISLAGKVAIVTGVSGDGQVGQAVARALAENGAPLAICARKQSNVEARAKELRDAGARVFAMVGARRGERFAFSVPSRHFRANLSALHQSWSRTSALSMQPNRQAEGFIYRYARVALAKQAFASPGQDTRDP